MAVGDATKIPKSNIPKLAYGAEINVRRECSEVQCPYLSKRSDPR